MTVNELGQSYTSVYEITRGSQYTEFNNVNKVNILNIMS